MPRRARTSELMWPRLFRRFEGRAGTLQGQLRDMLVNAVIEGFLAPGEALPSSRLLALRLGLSRTTVILALQALADKGLITARQRSGYFVSAELQATYLDARQRAEQTLPPSTIDWRARLKLQPSTQRNIQKPNDWQQQPYPGYPIVDAAMRQLNQTGYMHNRLRMIVASFLTKDLGIDWRLGERYFASQLIDHDLASNNGGWQWAASTGCDAQPYFRIFNPLSQSERFDADGKFIRQYVPELMRVPAQQIHAPWLLRPVDQAAFGCIVGQDYPLPIVDHAIARQRTLERYAGARNP